MKQTRSRTIRVAGRRRPVPKRASKWSRFTTVIAAVGAVAAAATGVWAVVDKTKNTVTDAVSDPLVVNVDYENGNHGSAVVVPAGVTVDPLKDGSIQDAITYYAKHGGYVPKHTVIYVRLTGQKNEAVDVTGVRAVQVTDGPPVNGTYLLSPSQGTGDLVPLHINLDNGAPTIEAHRMVVGPLTNPYVPGTMVDTGPYPGNQGDLILANDENGLLSIDVSAEKYSVAFKIEINTLVKGRPQPPIVVDTAGVGGHGDFFRVTAVCAADKHLTYQAGYVWSPGDAAHSKAITKIPASELSHPGEDC